MVRWPNDDIDEVQVQTRRLLDRLVDNRWEATPADLGEYARLSEVLKHLERRVAQARFHLDLIEQCMDPLVVTI